MVKTEVAQTSGFRAHSFEHRVSIHRNISKRYISVNQKRSLNTMYMYEQLRVVEREISIDHIVSVPASHTRIHTYIKSGMHIGFGQS